MEIKVYKRTPVLRNTILFIPLAVIWCASIFAISQGKSLFMRETAISFIRENIGLMSLGIVAYVLTIKISRLATFFLSIFLLTASINGFSFYFLEYDKLIMISSFLCFLLGFYVVLLHYLEIKGALFCPGFSKIQINKDSNGTLPAKITFKNQQAHNCKITNWAKSAFFILIDSKITKEMRGRVELEIYHDDHIFKTTGEIHTSYDDGLGILVKEKGSDKEDFNWINLFRIISDQGLTPYYNRK